MSNTEYQMQTLLDSIHSLHPASLTLDQLAHVLAAIRYAAPRWQDEYQRRQAAIARRREMQEAA